MSRARMNPWLGLMLPLVLLAGSCQYARDWAKQEAEKVVQEEVVPRFEKLSEEYISQEELAKWKAQADTDKSGEVSQEEWWAWIKGNWQYGGMLLLFEYLRRRLKGKIGQIWSELKKPE